MTDTLSINDLRLCKKIIKEESVIYNPHTTLIREHMNMKISGLQL